MSRRAVFSFDNYKAYLLHVEQSRGPFEKGFRSRLAEKLGCHNAFISQVLNGSANFSLEQALAASKYLGLTKTEQKYFLLLVEYARSGTQELKDYFEEQLEDLRGQSRNFQKRLSSKTIPDSARAVYYSQWYYAAIHILTSIPQFRTPAAIASALRLPKNVVEEVIVFLLSHDLLIKKRNEVHVGVAPVQLDRGSIEHVKHTTNFRILALRNLENNRHSDLHYSSVISLAKKDAEEFLEKYSAEVEELFKKIETSKEEKLYCFNVDFFELA